MASRDETREAKKAAGLCLHDGYGNKALLTPDNDITVTRMQVQLSGMMASGCSFLPYVLLHEKGQDLKLGVWIANDAASFDSGPITMDYSAGTQLVVFAGQGTHCVRQPAGASVTIQYKVR